MSNTPRTDAAAFYTKEPIPTVRGNVREFVTKEFARELERENADLKERFEVLRRGVAAAVTALELGVCGVDAGKPAGSTSTHCTLCSPEFTCFSDLFSPCRKLPSPRHD